MKPRILVAGSANMDIVFPMQKFPGPGESMIAESNCEYVPGGKGANTAVALARIGADVIFCARVGHDANGDKLIEAYKEEKIDTRYVIKDKNTPTGIAAILLEEKTAQNRIIVYPGSNMNLSSGDIENAFLSYPDALLMQFEISDEAILTAVDFAKKQQIPVFIDAGPIREGLPYDKLENVEIISPNETEIELITGIAPVSADSCLESCIRLSTIVKSKYVVLKLSNRGCFLYDGKYCEFIQSHEVNAVDTTAAGDAFTAALTSEYLRTKDISHSCKFANVAGALAVTKFGAMPSLPTSRQIDEFIYRRNLKI